MRPKDLQGEVKGWVAHGDEDDNLILSVSLTPRRRSVKDLAYRREHREANIQSTMNRAGERITHEAAVTLKAPLRDGGIARAGANDKL